MASDRQTVYAMTGDGRLIKTIDGGLSWSERESGTGKGISSMSLVPGGDESGSEPQSINNGNNTINIIEPEKQESR